LHRVGLVLAWHERHQEPGDPQHAHDATQYRAGPRHLGGKW
jgi:hypothetical protein